MGAGGPVLAIFGPTACGKTEAAIAVAERIGAEIVSADSMLVYRGMDVGTAKPSAAERARVRHHLVDVADPSEAFSVARYQALAAAALEEIRGRGARPLLVGGTVLYARAVVDELAFPPTDELVRSSLEAEGREVGAEALYARLAASDPPAAARIEPANVRRTVRALEVAEVTGRPFSSFATAWDRYEPDRMRAAGIEMPADVLAHRIEERVARMVDGGLLEEVRGLVARGFGAWLTASQAIGYAEFAGHLEGARTLDDAVARTVRRTKALARRQMAFLRRDPRIRWFEAGPAGAVALADEIAGYLEGRTDG